MLLWRYTWRIHSLCSVPLKVHSPCMYAPVLKGTSNLYTWPNTFPCKHLNLHKFTYSLIYKMSLYQPIYKLRWFLPTKISFVQLVHDFLFPGWLPTLTFFHYNNPFAKENVKWFLLVKVENNTYLSVHSGTHNTTGCEHKDSHNIPDPKTVLLNARDTRSVLMIPNQLLASFTTLSFSYNLSFST